MSEDVLSQARVGDVAGYEEISKMIPHRYPFLMVDRMEDMIDFKTATGIKNVTINEPFFQGHFPGHPVMPGVLIVEAMAQTAGILVIHSLNKEDPSEETKERLVYFMSVETAKFRKPVGPGDRLYLKVKALQNRRNVWKFEGKAYVDDAIVAEAQYTAMIMTQD
ncbi:MAG: 3-hydroxyacyl-ACP dehydratase FabZ [Pseudomonadota bacterium]